MGVSTPVSLVGESSESQRLRVVARRAREEIMRAGQGGVAMAALQVGEQDGEAVGGLRLGEDDVGLGDPAPQPELGAAGESEGTEGTEDEKEEDEDPVPDIEEEEQVRPSTSTSVPRIYV